MVAGFTSRFMTFFGKKIECLFDGIKEPILKGCIDFVYRDEKVNPSLDLSFDFVAFLSVSLLLCVIDPLVVLLFLLLIRLSYRKFIAN